MLMDRPLLWARQAVTRSLILVSVFCTSAMADKEATNAPVLRCSESGRGYAKSIPEDAYGQKGQTRVYRVSRDDDVLMWEYDWYAREIYIGGFADATLVRFGP